MDIGGLPGRLSFPGFGGLRDSRRKDEQIFHEHVGEQQQFLGFVLAWQRPGIIVRVRRNPDPPDPLGPITHHLGQDTIRNVLVVAPLSFHPGRSWRLVAGPGVEFTSEKDKFAFRLGGGYEFQLAGSWTLAPEVFVDLIESGSAVA